jgi:hypothetical protein
VITQELEKEDVAQLDEADSYEDGWRKVVKIYRPRLEKQLKKAGLLGRVEISFSVVPNIRNGTKGGDWKILLHKKYK